MPVETVRWHGGLDGALRIIDQRLLPGELKFRDLATVEDVFDAIRTLAVRGAPAIGIAAGYGAFIGVRDFTGDAGSLYERLDEVCDYLAKSRPTAVNLFYALDRVRSFARSQESPGVEEIKKALLAEAHRILEEDLEASREMGINCQQFVEDGGTYLTNCNAGGLATGGYGTALAAFYVAKEQGKTVSVYACETRPLLQGARLTTWELMQEGIKVTLICDNMAATVLRQGRVGGIFVGADRIASNGDAANKIGTYPLAVLAREHGVPFYVVAPLSSFDFSLKSGDEIPIEERAPEEVTSFRDARSAPEGVEVFNPAFDVTPADLITAIVCERGVVRSPDSAALQALLQNGSSQ
jgi:methylthioribose-1-phosphate isomerase